MAQPDPDTGAVPSLTLSVQYATTAAELPRWRLRRWVEQVLRRLAALPPDSARPALPEALALTLRLVDAAEGRELNLAYRQRDYATNVLTFDYGDTPDGTRHADVVLCLPVLHAEAAEQHKPLLAHAAHLVTHGTLHALGYDHEDDEEALLMESLEIAILAYQRLPNPYTDD